MGIAVERVNSIKEEASRAWVLLNKETIFKNLFLRLYREGP